MTVSKFIFLLVFIAFFCMTGCTDSKGTRRILKTTGYGHIQITGYRFFSCSETDVFATGFKATKNNQPISGVVCRGWLKKSTIRYD